MATFSGGVVVFVDEQIKGMTSLSHGVQQGLEGSQHLLGIDLEGTTQRLPNNNPKQALIRRVR